MSQLINLEGMTFFRFSVIRRETNGPTGKTRWLCKCSCGTSRIVIGSDLRSGSHKSCGCLRHTPEHKPWKIHGMCDSPTYQSWSAMKDRCLNAQNHSFSFYGKRGIVICERWLRFENFLEDMGERPEGMTLDRYPDNNGDYEPNNCRWATPKQQAHNRRDNRLIEAFGETKTLTGWSEDSRCRVIFITLKKRLDAKWDSERAISLPAIIGWRKGIKGGWSDHKRSIRS